MDENSLKLLIRSQIENFAIASGIPYDDPDFLGLFCPSADGWNHANAYIMARLSRLAYKEKAFIKDYFDKCDAVLSDYAWFEDKSVNRRRNTDTQGFGIRLGDDFILVFRGTESKKDAIMDGKLLPTDFVVNGNTYGKVHRGFLQCYESISDQVENFLGDPDPAKAVWFTGHSLGGAIATVAFAATCHSPAATTAKGLYTFGQPRVGNATFRNSTIDQLGGKHAANQRIFRVFRCADPVAMLPKISYRHLDGELCYISKSGSLELGVRRRRRYIERTLTWLAMAPKFLANGSIKHLETLVSDHYSAGYLDAIRASYSSYKALEGITAGQSLE